MLARLETLKKRIDEIAVRRMLKDSADHFDCRNPGRLDWRQCDHCSELYNRHEEPWKSRGAGKAFCSTECKLKQKEIAWSLHNNAKNKPKPAAKRHLAPAGKRPSTKIDIVEADARKRLRTLARWFEDAGFTFLDAARALKLMRKAARVHVLNMASRGWMRRIEDRGNFSQYALDLDHETARETLEAVRRGKK